MCARQFSGANKFRRGVIHYIIAGVTHISKMYQIASRLDVRPHWDSGIKPSMVESLTDVCYIARYVFKPPKIAFMADAHEFITMRAEQWEPDGSCMILQCSIEHPDYVNVKKGHKRSELDLGGFHITKVSDKSCVITYVNQSKRLFKNFSNKYCS